MITETLMQLDLDLKEFDPGPLAKPFFYEMINPLADCMYDAYRNSREYENEEPSDFETEISNILKGLYGVYMPEASFVLGDDPIGGAILICLFKGEPTITYLFVHPDRRRQGMAGMLLDTACHALKKNGYHKLMCYLNLDNPAAYALYDQYGFNEVTPAAAPEQIEE